MEEVYVWSFYPYDADDTVPENIAQKMWLFCSMITKTEIEKKLNGSKHKVFLLFIKYYSFGFIYPIDNNYRSFLYTFVFSS